MLVPQRAMSAEMRGSFRPSERSAVWATRPLQSKPVSGEMPSNR
ncbi:Uncharacterised protein [Bordetella pertussis]|nr:Uncharacterised protein [Bordetella pertussis]